MSKWVSRLKKEYRLRQELSDLADINAAMGHDYDFTPEQLALVMEMLAMEEHNEQD